MPVLPVKFCESGLKNLGHFFNCLVFARFLEVIFGSMSILDFELAVLVSSYLATLFEAEVQLRVLWAHKKSVPTSGFRARPQHNSIPSLGETLKVPSRGLLVLEGGRSKSPSVFLIELHIQR